MRAIIFFFAAAFLFSCGNGSPSKTEGELAEAEAKKMQRLTDSVNIAAQDNKYVVEEEPEMLPKEIPFDLFKKQKVDLDTPFVADSALVALFPGNYYPGEETMVVWTSPKTKPRHFTTWMADDTATFPGKGVFDGTETRVGTELDYTDDNGIRNVLISFSSFNFSGDLLRCGRFACAHMALAHFRLEKGRWILKEFTPAIGCYGAFGNLPSITLLKFGRNNYGVNLEDSNGGAGGVYYGDTHVFGLINGRFRELLLDRNTSLGNAMSAWDPKYSTAEGNKAFCDLRRTITGTYQTYDAFIAQEDDTTSVPAAIKEIIKTKEHFKFTIVTDFIFRDGKYVLMHEDASISDLPKEEWAQWPRQ